MKTISISHGSKPQVKETTKERKGKKENVKLT